MTTPPRTALGLGPVEARELPLLLSHVKHTLISLGYDKAALIVARGSAAITALVDQRIEHGDSTSGVAGSNPAERAIPLSDPPLLRLREALEFYADPFAWKKKHDPDDVARIPDFYSETSFGDTAVEALASLPTLKSAEADTFQDRVRPWMLECFGPVIPFDKVERNHRFLEEALELVQSLGCSRSEAHQLVDYVFDRPVGDPPQESGGVSVTHAALCIANNLDMNQCAEDELARIWTKVEKIRAKQAAKPKHSPLPGPSDALPPTQKQDRAGTARDWVEDRGYENGEYECQCCECGNSFIGYKRRVLCKVCSNLLRLPASTSSPVGDIAPDVHRVMDEGDGAWVSCSGCHELSDGAPTGPYSATFRCHLGLGCGECGGIGAVWDSHDYSDIIAPSDTSPVGETTEAQIGAWIDRELSGYAVALRSQSDDPVPGEPFISRAVAHSIIRKALLATPPAVSDSAGVVLSAGRAGDYLSLADLIEKKRNAVLDEYGKDGFDKARRDLLEVLWGDKGTFAPALRLAAAAHPARGPDLLNEAHYQINALGGVPSNEVEEAINETVGKALLIIEKLGGVDPLTLPRRRGPDREAIARALWDDCCPGMMWGSEDEGHYLRMADVVLAILNAEAK